MISIGVVHQGLCQHIMPRREDWNKCAALKFH